MKYYYTIASSQEGAKTIEVMGQIFDHGTQCRNNLRENLSGDNVNRHYAFSDLETLAAIPCMLGFVTIGCSACCSSFPNFVDVLDMCGKESLNILRIYSDASRSSAFERNQSVRDSQLRRDTHSRSVQKWQ